MHHTLGFLWDTRILFKRFLLYWKKILKPESLLFKLKLLAASQGLPYCETCHFELSWACKLQQPYCFVRQLLLRYKRRDPCYRQPKTFMHSSRQRPPLPSPSVWSLIQTWLAMAAAFSVSLAVIFLFRRANYQCRTHVRRTGCLIPDLVAWWDAPTLCLWSELGMWVLDVVKICWFLIPLCLAWALVRALVAPHYFVFTHSADQRYYKCFATPAQAWVEHMQVTTSQQRLKTLVESLRMKWSLNSF